MLQNAIDKLALMSVLLVDPASQAQELTKSVGEELSRMITQQKQLEHRFQELISAQPALRQLSNKAALQRNQAELQEVSAALRQATKQLCRNLRDNPNISENMAKVAAQREALRMLFSNTIDSLVAQGTVQPIIEAVLASEQAEVSKHSLLASCQGPLAALQVVNSRQAYPSHEQVCAMHNCRSLPHAALHPTQKIQLTEPASCADLACPACMPQAQMRELVEAEKTATALVKALKSDLAAEKAQHDQQV